jgi:tetratricopeptide (TPR) repeat protein
VALLRSQILVEVLNDTAEARKLLAQVAERSDNSAPLIQLAIVDLKRHDRQAVANTIAKIRSRWKEAAIADLLDAQLALDQQDLSAALGHLEAAHKKDPSDKQIQYWKARLDSRNGATTAAAEALEAIVERKPTKEIDPGVSLMAAAQSSLADIALQNGDFDNAIHRLEDLKAASQGGLTRQGRWQLINAYSAKGQWSTAKRELAAMLNDEKSPPSNDERVRASILYQANNDTPAALAQLDYVIKVDPTHTSAVANRAYILSSQKKNAEAAVMLRAAIDAPRKENPPAVLYAMLAAVQSLNTNDKSLLRIALATLDEGLAKQPDSFELINAKYKVLRVLEGPKAALEFFELKAKASSEPKVRRALVDVYRDQKRYDGALNILREILAENPKDALAANHLVRITALQAADAGTAGKPELQRTLNESAATMLREFRARFPNDLSFLQLDCDLAAMRGDLNLATSITQEMDKIAKGSPAGPLSRARIYQAQGRIREAVDNYTEALERNPRQLDVRVLLGMANLKLGKTDEAIRQA